MFVFDRKYYNVSDVAEVSSTFHVDWLQPRRKCGKKCAKRVPNILYSEE